MLASELSLYRFLDSEMSVSRSNRHPSEQVVPPGGGVGPGLKTGARQASVSSGYPLREPLPVVPKATGAGAGAGHGTMR